MGCAMLCENTPLRSASSAIIPKDDGRKASSELTGAGACEPRRPKLCPIPSSPDLVLSAENAALLGDIARRLSDWFQPEHRLAVLPSRLSPCILPSREKLIELSALDSAEPVSQPPEFGNWAAFGRELAIDIWSRERSALVVALLEAALLEADGNSVFSGLQRTSIGTAPRNSQGNMGDPIEWFCGSLTSSGGALSWKRWLEHVGGGLIHVALSENATAAGAREMQSAIGVHVGGSRRKT
eukprot:1404527-Rhodomonas_salina.3